MNTASTDTTVLLTPIAGIPYREAMQYSASIGSLVTLKNMIQELDDQCALTDGFSDFVSYCKRASEFEDQFGPDCLLDLSHPGVMRLIENVIRPKELVAIQQRQATIAMNPADAARAEVLRAEGRRLAYSSEKQK